MTGSTQGIKFRMRPPRKAVQRMGLSRLCWGGVGVATSELVEFMEVDSVAWSMKEAAVWQPGRDWTGSISRK